MRELGDYPADFEPWFLEWNSALFYPNPTAKITVYGFKGQNGVIPVHEHDSCKSKVLASTKYPPRVCPGCGKDTLHEHNQKSEEKRRVWLPSH